jgi:hypothetical protein
MTSSRWYTATSRISKRSVDVLPLLRTNEPFRGFHYCSYTEFQGASGVDHWWVLVLLSAVCSW